MAKTFIEKLKVGLPLNLAGDRIIRWKKPIAEVIAESVPRVTRFQRWGSIPPDSRTIVLHKVTLSWEDIEVRELPGLHTVQFQYCNEHLNQDEIHGSLVLFCKDKALLHLALTKAFGNPGLRTVQLDRGGSAEMRFWPIDGVGEILDGYANCVFLTVWPTGPR
jgi:hypothetical protein